MASRRAITKAQAVRYRSASRAEKSEILDLVCAVTGFNRDYARRALKQALRPRVVKARALRPPKYDVKVVAALQKCWAVVNAPAGKRLAPILAELVPLLRGHGELDIDDDTAVLLIAMSAATIDRRLAPARSTLVLKGRSHTKPGSLLKSRIPMRTWRVDSSKVRAGPPPRVTPTPPAAVGSVPGYAADRHVNGRPGTMSARYSGSRVGHHHENLLDVLIGPQRGRLGEVPLRHGGQRGWAEPPAPAQVSVWVTLLSPRGTSGFSPSARARPSASS
jgi:hypothetical protein